MRTLTLILAVALLAGTAHAQRQRDPQHKAAVQELRLQMRTWFERHVAPTVREWQRAYDATLSAEDLATVKRLRTEAAALRAKHHAAMASGQGKPSKEQRHEMRADMKALGQQVRPIMERSRQTLRDLFEKNEETIERWRDDAEAIVEAWEDKYDDLDGPFGPGMNMDPSGLLRGRARHAAVRFVLWDGTTPAPEGAPSQGRLTPAPPVRIIPAPTGESATVMTEMVPDGPVTIEIYDLNGKLVKTTAATSRTGHVEQVVDTSDLVPGTYMASVRSAEGRRTSQLVIAR